MTRRRAYLAVLLGGSTILLGLTICGLPPSAALFKAPTTPFDRIPGPTGAGSFRLLSRAAPLIPTGASVLVRSEPRDPQAEGALHRHGVALFPGRQVLPAARWGVSFPDADEEADFLVVVGSRPSPPPGTLLLETPDGSVWRRGNP